MRQESAEWREETAALITIKHGRSFWPRELGQQGAPLRQAPASTIAAYVMAAEGPLVGVTPSRSSPQQLRGHAVMRVAPRQAHRDLTI